MKRVNKKKLIEDLGSFLGANLQGTGLGQAGEVGKNFWDKSGMSALWQKYSPYQQTLGVFKKFSDKLIAMKDRAKILQELGQANPIEAIGQKDVDEWNSLLGVKWTVQNVKDCLSMMKAEVSTLFLYGQADVGGIKLSGMLADAKSLKYLGIQGNYPEAIKEFLKQLQNICNKLTWQRYVLELMAEQKPFVVMDETELEKTARTDFTNIVLNPNSLPEFSQYFAVAKKIAEQMGKDFTEMGNQIGQAPAGGASPAGTASAGGQTQQQALDTTLNKIESWVRLRSIGESWLTEVDAPTTTTTPATTTPPPAGNTPGEGQTPSVEDQKAFIEQAKKYLLFPEDDQLMTSAYTAFDRGTKAFSQRASKFYIVVAKFLLEGNGVDKTNGFVDYTVMEKVILQTTADNIIKAVKDSINASAEKAKNKNTTGETL